MKIWAVPCFFIMVTAAALFGQSAAELERRYGAGKFYAIGSTVLVRPHFDNLGQIWAELIPNPHPKDEEGFSDAIPVRRFPPDHAFMLPSDLLTADDVVAAFNELAPAGSRKGFGRRYREFSGFGWSHVIGYKYENVTFLITVSITQKLSTSFVWEGATFDTAFDSPVGKPVGAAIFWTERMCSYDPTLSDWDYPDRFISETPSIRNK